jgi:hypothetical protein
LSCRRKCDAHAQPCRHGIAHSDTAARYDGLTQLLLGQATDLTAYPIDALNSAPFIVDDLSSTFGYVLARHQAPRRSHRLSWFDRHASSCPALIENVRGRCFGFGTSQHHREVA